MILESPFCLVAFAVSLDGNGIKFGLGDNGDLSVEVDAEMEISLVTLSGDKRLHW